MHPELRSKMSYFPSGLILSLTGCLGFLSVVPTYEETQEEITPCPLYENLAHNDESLCLSPQQVTSGHSSYQYPSLNSSSRVRLQVSLPPAWPSECATLTNYRYQSIAVDHYSMSEPVLLLDRNGRPLRPGRSGSADPFLQQRIGDFLHTQEAIEHDIHATSPHGSDSRVANGGPRSQRYEFSVEREGDDDTGAFRRRRERTCAKGFFVVSLIISAIALIVFLVIAVLKSIHIM